MVGIGEHLPQVMKRLAQIHMRLGLGRIRPQEKGQVRASLGSSPVQHEVGEQRLQPRYMNRRHRVVTQNQEEIAEQMNTERRDHQVPPSQYPSLYSAVASTDVPRTASSNGVYSAALCERPSTLGTNSIAVGPRRAINSLSCPAPLGISLQVAPRASAAVINSCWSRESIRRGKLLPVISLDTASPRSPAIVSHLVRIASTSLCFVPSSG